MISSTLTKPHPDLTSGQPREDACEQGAWTHGQGIHGLHVAIIMDGNGRWAQRRGRPRGAGHVAGAAAVRRTVEAASGFGITTLTLYAFSADNWKRPQGEVDHLMRLFRSHLRAEASRCVENGIRMSIIGRRDRLPPGLEETIRAVEEKTAGGGELHLRLAIDYSARDALVAAAAVHKDRPTSRDGFGAALAHAIHAPIGTRDVDLLIRTGGERRLSDFLLWESAYAELLFVEQAWPDFTAADLAEAVHEFSSRNRRFGGLPNAGETRGVRSIGEGRRES